MKKIINIALSLIFIIVLSIILVEGFITFLPIAYKLLPPKDDNIFVYVLGESSAYGQPFSGKIQFSKIMAYMADNKIDNKNIKLVVFAEPGSRIIHQYFKYFLYRFFNPFDKGIVLLYLGINDNVKNKEEYSFLYSLVVKSKILNLIYLCFYDTHDLYNDYEKLLILIKRFGDDVFISTIIGNYFGFMPQDIDVLLENKVLYDKIKYIDNLILNKKYNEALKLCNELDKNPQVLYRIAKIYEYQGKIKEAKYLYISMLDDIGDKRPNKEKNYIIRYLARKYNILFIDMFGYLYDNDDKIGYNFFVDKVHPNLKLHTIIAKRFIDIISTKHTISLKKEINSAYELYNIFNFSKEDLFVLYRDALGEIFSFSYISTVLDVYNISVIKEYIGIMSKIDEEIGDNNINRKFTLVACNVLLEYIQGNYSSAKEILLKTDLLENMDRVQMHRWNEKLKNFIYELNI